MDRRGFIAGSLLASVAASSVAAVPARAFGSNRTVRLDRFIVDERFADARAVASQVASRHVPVSTFSADLTALWYEELDLQWRERAESFAGMTTKEGLFVLETLAADRGMRVIVRAQHEPPAAGRVRHAWRGHDALAMTGGYAGDWRGIWADALLSVPVAGIAVRSQAITESADRARTIPLYSWVIAPRQLTAARA